MASAVVRGPAFRGLDADVETDAPPPLARSCTHTHTHLKIWAHWQGCSCLSPEPEGRAGRHLNCHRQGPIRPPPGDFGVAAALARAGEDESHWEPRLSSGPGVCSLEGLGGSSAGWTRTGSSEPQAGSFERGTWGQPGVLGHRPCLPRMRMSPRRGPRGLPRRERPS